MMVVAMSLAVKNLVDEIGELVSLPEVVMQVNEMVDSEQYNANDIGKVISRDPGLSTRLLRIANSPMYGNSRKIDSINHAVVILGTKQIRDLVFSTTATRAFDGIPNDIISVEDFWHHSLYCGLLARSLACVSRKISADTMFTAGLLHDIGHLVLMNRVPEQTAASILLTVQGEAKISLLDAENEMIGFTHADVGAGLAEQWHLPEILTECIAHHHHPQMAQSFPEAVSHIYIANRIASMPYDDLPGDAELSEIDPYAWRMSGLAVSDITDCVIESKEQLVETKRLLFDD